VDAIQKNSNSEALTKEGRKTSMRELHTKFPWRIILLLYFGICCGIRNKLAPNCGSMPLEPRHHSKVFLLYITTSNEVPRDRKIDEKNNHVMVVPGKKLDSLLLNQYLNIINHISDQNEWKFTSEELELCK
jgi:hypothetical protein